MMLHVETSMKRHQQFANGAPAAVRAGLQMLAMLHFRPTRHIIKL